VNTAPSVYRFGFVDPRITTNYGFEACGSIRGVMLACWHQSWSSSDPTTSIGLLGEQKIGGDLE